LLAGIRSGQNRQIRLRFVALALIVLSAVLATTASAHESRITIAAGAPYAHGKVKSETDRCEGNRKIKLYRNGELFKTGHSRDSGYWHIGTQFNGYYYARLIRRDDCGGTARGGGLSAERPSPVPRFGRKAAIYSHRKR
jgi:hypothetical protein